MTAFAWEILQFRQPWWLLIMLQPLIVILFLRIQTIRKNNDFADAELLPWLVTQSDVKTKRRSRQHYIVLQLVWVLFAIAMAGPRYPDPPQAVDHSNGVDVMILLDVSRSMTATDVKPSRLKRAKAELYQILSLNKSDKLGIILFAGQPHLMSPLTWDRNVLQFYVKGIRENLMPTQGSDLTAAIRLANKELKRSANKAILVLTDGEQNTDIKVSDEILQTPLFIIGVGTHEGISIPDAKTGWLMHERQSVRTRLKDDTLKKLASRSGGGYVIMTDDMSDLEQVYSQGINRLTEEVLIDANDKQAWVELYAWFLLSGCLLLLFTTVDWVRLLSRSSQILLIFLTVGALIPTSDSYAEVISPSKQQEAYQLYNDKDYQGALDIYSLSTGFVARMGEGASSYKMQDYASAITQFTQAFLIAETDVERANALYNLANSFFSIRRYGDAVITYEDALRYEPQHDEAKKNKEFVVSVIASLKNDPFYNAVAGRRAGRGPRSARISENAGGSGDFSLGEEEIKQTIYSKSEQTETALNAIAKKGQQAQVVDRGVNQQGDKRQKIISAVDILEARRIVLQSKQDQSLLWKSLFEDEEGFPAPLSEPVALPGVLPW